MKRILKSILKRLPGMSAIDRRLRRHYTGNDRPELVFRGSWGSPLPGFDEIRDRAAELFRTDIALGEDIDLRETQQIELLRELAALAAEFDWPQQPDPARRFYTGNGWYCETDALILYGLLRRHRPARIIEVGSGHSSALMLDTIERFLDSKTHLTCIEPNPERLMASLREPDKQCVEVLPVPVQQVPPARFAELGANDLLFIDSSHVGKIGSDLLFLLFEALPRIGPGCIVHFHDIFWPFEYPREWLEEGRAWNEIYFLRAFLQYNRRFEVLLFNHLLQTRHADAVRGCFPRFLNETSSSLWLRKC